MIYDIMKMNNSQHIDKKRREKKVEKKNIHVVGHLNFIMGSR